MKAIFLAFCAALALWLGAGFWSCAEADEAPLPGPQVMRQLQRDRGCTICHEEKTAPVKADSVLPPAPSWQQIAARYRRVPGAQGKLEALVLTGSDPENRHWKSSVAIDRMLPNEIATTPEEANQLVRWILAH